MKRAILFVFTASWSLLACGSPSQGAKDAGPDVPVIDPGPVDIPADPAVLDLAGDPGKPGKWVRPANAAALRISVDDRANQTYQDKQMKWTGSFSWNEADNTITFSSAWLPSDGPYPPLYDDGPWSAGGHEPEGAVKGDHVFQSEIWFVADEDTDFEYGLLNEFDRWIWIGPNGQIHVSKGSTDDLDVKGLVIPKFGDIDLKLTLDLGALHPAHATVTPDKFNVYLKSSVNSWTPMQLLDNGEKGDDKANDKVYTYVQSLNMGPHDGLLFENQHAQFVFVFAMPEINPDEGLEYKVGTQCAIEGVKAYTDQGSKGTFHEVKVVFERNARGKEFNTTVITGDEGPWCEVGEDCFGGLLCKGGECAGEVQQSDPVIAMIDPPKGPISGGTDVTISGKDFRDGALVRFGDVPATDVVVASATEITAKTPAHAKGKVSVTVKNPDGGEDTYVDGFEYVEQAGPNLVDWGRLDPPVSVETFIGTATEPLYAEVYEAGITDTDTGGEGFVKAEVGYGAPGSDPSGWTFENAAFDKKTGNNGVFTGTLVPDATGEFAFTFRFSLDGGASWAYVDQEGLASGSNGKFGTLKVLPEPTGPVVLSVVPPWSPTAGKAGIVVNGKNFKAEAKVWLDALEVTPSSVTATSVTFDAPAHAIGFVSVTVKNPDGESGTKKDGLAYVPRGTPTIDGDVGADWDPSWRIATNALPTDWGADKNVLTELYAAYDDTLLYVGIKGICESSNAILGYLDRDFGAGTGVADMAGLKDDKDDLDSALSSKVKVTVAGFGADKAFGTRGMKSVVEAMDGSAGWRDLSNWDDFGWDTGSVVTQVGGNGVEASIPLTTVFGGPIPSTGTRVAIVVALVGGSGDYLSNQCLPGLADGGSATAIGEVATFPVR